MGGAQPSSVLLPYSISQVTFWEWVTCFADSLTRFCAGLGSEILDKLATDLSLAWFRDLGFEILFHTHTLSYRHLHPCLPTHRIGNRLYPEAASPPFPTFPSYSSARRSRFPLPSFQPLRKIHELSPWPHRLLARASGSAIGCLGIKARVFEIGVKPPGCEWHFKGTANRVVQNIYLGVSAFCRMSLQSLWCSKGHSIAVPYRLAVYA